MAGKHALLSPSSAHRWLACPPSARFEEQIPQQESAYAAEGMLAHELAATLLLREAGLLLSETVYDAKMEGFRRSPLYTEEMLEHCRNYAHLVADLGGQIDVERGYDLSALVPMSHGTADAVSTRPPHLRVIDFKYGTGVRVSATANPQMMLYALGALGRAEDKGLTIETVTLMIYQPRAGGESSWKTTPAELKRWAEEVVAPAARLAVAGMGDFTPGDHCRFCRARTSCRAYFARFAEVLKIRDSREMDDLERRAVLDLGPALTKWIKAVQEDAVGRLSSGRAVPGFKLVQGRGRRAFTDENRVATTLIGSGAIPAEEVYTYSLRSLTDLERTLGRKRFTELLGDLVTMKEAGPVLAPVDDPRPEYCADQAIEYELADIL